ncbi:adrenodoxin-like protein 2, mitochondrial [Ziziphus jujuba]|uniref:Adrenodoxin-like protein 2, mitochondrial n=1 Tax=Ziziphus jujuba TaxID=326968 RepID=A0A6P3ZFH9_ZIZJJ|nr:adrenodoxin-like protein 2, mitochondrial [Ziziphus jujuba]
MFFPKLSRVGIRMVKELTRGKTVSLIRAGYIHRPYREYLPKLFEKQSETLVSSGAIFQKYHHFSTTVEGSSEEGSKQEKKISVTFVDKDGEEHHIKVPVGMSMLEAAHENDIELEGACEGSLACSTCHVIVMDMEHYNMLEEPTDEENDMLDLAFGLTETSRLGCQVIAKPELDGIRLAIPAATRNFAVDGYVPKPH